MIDFVTRCQGRRPSFPLSSSPSLLISPHVRQRHTQGEQTDSGGVEREEERGRGRGRGRGRRGAKRRESPNKTNRNNGRLVRNILCVSPLPHTHTHTHSLLFALKAERQCAQCPSLSLVCRKATKAEASGSCLLRPRLLTPHSLSFVPSFSA